MISGKTIPIQTVSSNELMPLCLRDFTLIDKHARRIVKLYKKLGFNITYLAGPRRISCTGDRSAAKEVLALKGFRT